jgi:hypothetical protein
MASERRETGKHVSVHYAEVLSDKVEGFLQDFRVSRERTAKLAVPTAEQDFTLWIPPAGSIFDLIANAPTLGQMTKIRQGLHWNPRKDGEDRLHRSP